MIQIHSETSLCLHNLHSCLFTIKILLNCCVTKLTYSSCQCNLGALWHFDMCNISTDENAIQFWEKIASKTLPQIFLTKNTLWVRIKFLCISPTINLNTLDVTDCYWQKRSVLRQYKSTIKCNINNVKIRSAILILRGD